MIDSNSEISNGVYQTLLKPLFKDVKTFVLDTLFPITCLSCEAEEGSFICSVCKPVVSRLEHQRCITCKKPSPFGLTHNYCQTPHGADGLISFYNYHDEKVKKIIIAGKYSFIPDTYLVLGEMIVNIIKKDFPDLLNQDNLILTPIPLHSMRKRWRGFNQAEVLCEVISKELNLHTLETLKRSKLTRTQKNLKKEQRLQNMQEAFKLKPGAEVRDKNIILVDDVTTTGATLQEATKVLKRNGASRVLCLTIARD